MKKILILWNGMESGQVSGGDLFTKKIVENIKGELEIILSINAKKIIDNLKNKKFFITDDKSAEGNFGMIGLYANRIKKSLKIINRNKTEYDLAISSSPFIYDLIPVIFSNSKRKVVVQFHIIPKRNPKNVQTKIRFALAGLENKISVYLIKKFFDEIVVGNEEVKNELRKSMRNKKIIIADAGFNSEKIGEKIGEKKDSNLACFVGRLTTQKGILDLVDIMKEVNKKFPKLNLEIIGDGPDKKEILKKIDKNEIKSIRMRGFVDEKTKYSLMKKSKFFFFPSYEEGWGIALAEALYCNCLCFCYELPHYKGIFSDYPIYINLGNKKQFAEKVMKNYKKIPDKKQREFIKKYDDKIIIKKILEKI